MPHIQLHLTGQRFGRLTVLESVGQRNGGYFWWAVRCDCGKIKAVRGSRLISGNTVSCGCLRREMGVVRGKIFGPKSAVHGATRGGKWTPEYMTWYAMRQRVNNPRHEHFRYYGGRGIKICLRWRNFANFLADMGKRPQGKTLDRKNTNGNYTPKNCRWATWKEQAASRRKRKWNEGRCNSSTLQRAGDLSNG